MEDLGFVYIIRNIVNQKVYVGVSVNYHNRFLQHKSYLAQNKHHSIRLQHAWNKYGEESFSFEVVKSHPLSSLYEEEIRQILFFNSYYGGYNMTKGGDGGDWRPVLQYDRFGNFIKRFPSITEASVTLQIHGTYIWKCCNGKQHTTGAFQWCYEGKEEGIKLVCKDRSLIRPVFKYNLDGSFIQGFPNGIEAAKSIPVTKNKSIRSVAINIRKVCALTSILAYNYQWRFDFTEFIAPVSLEELKQKQIRGLLDPKNKVDRRRQIEQWSIEGELIKTYKNFNEVKSDWGSKINAIGQCLQGIQMTSHGFKWVYEGKIDEIKYTKNKRKCYYRNGQKHIIKNPKS